MKHRFVTNGKLKILLYDADITMWVEQGELWAQQLEGDIKAGMYKGKLKPSDYITETQRLIQIAEKILLMPDIFDYIPLTKAGLMPLNRSILLADSKCERLDYNSGTIHDNRLQLRLTDCYLTPEDIISGKRSNLAKSLEIRFFNDNGNQKPIMDDNGRIIISKVSRPTNCIEVQIPGRVYRDKSGVEHLYLGKLQVQTMVMHPAGKQEEPNKSVGHFYIKLTDSLKSRINSTIKDLNTLYRLLASIYKDEKNGWVTKCSIYSRHKQSVKSTGVVVSNPSVRLDSFTCNSTKNNLSILYRIASIK